MPCGRSIKAVVVVVCKPRSSSASGPRDAGRDTHLPQEETPTMCYGPGAGMNAACRLASRRRRRRRHPHTPPPLVPDAVRGIAAERARGARMGREERRAASPPVASRPSAAKTTRLAGAGPDPRAAHCRGTHVGRLGQACATAAAAKPAAWRLPRLACHCVGVCWAEARARREARAPPCPSPAWEVGEAHAVVDSCDESGREKPAHRAAALDGRWWAHQRPSGP